MQPVKSLFYSALVFSITLSNLINPNAGSATDLKVGDVLSPPGIIFVDDEVNVSCVVENINVLQADAFTLMVKINNPAGQAIFSEDIAGTNLPANILI